MVQLARSGWDDVIVGAGSAGAVLASRLSERGDRRVLLLEAGADDAALTPHAPGQPVLTGHNWDYVAHLGADGEGRQFPYRVGKVVGGSSAVNGAVALRGLPRDFDGWAAAGNPEWAWRRVLPYFIRLEADADFKDEEHGSDGPIPIRRLPAGEFGVMAIAFRSGCRALGLPDLPDLNRGADIGVGPLPTNSLGGQRMSTAVTYLALARVRPNLTVRSGCQVTRVLVDGDRAVGVEVLSDGRLHQVRAGQVTLCAGAASTPAILQRSGVGAARRLASLGIRPVADLPGVGENLADHPTMAIWTLPAPGVCQEGGPWHSVMARVASTGGEPDFGIFLATNVTTGTINIPGIDAMLAGRTAAAVSAMLLDPVSRGTVFLRDSAPDAHPEIVLRLASAPSDLDRLVRGTRLAWSLLRSSPFAELVERVLVWTDRLVDDDRMLRRAIPKFVSPMWHPAGTARMGPATDDMAVVDQHCRVHLMRALRVVDASVMPSIPSAPTNLSCIMLAERVAEWMG